MYLQGTTPNLFKSYWSWEYVLASEKTMVQIYNLIQLNMWYGVINRYLIKIYTGICCYAFSKLDFKCVNTQQY